MKKNSIYVKHLLAAILLIIGDVSYGQVLPSIKSNSRDTIYKATVGGDIKIELQLNASDPSLIALKCGINPYIVKLNDSIYHVRFQSTVDEAKIKLYYKNLPIEIKTFKIENLTLPNLMVDGSSTQIKKKTSNEKRIHAIEWNEGIDIVKNNFRIYNARVVLTEEGKPPMTFQMRHAELPLPIYNLLPTTKIGSTITVSDINFVNNYGNVFLIQGTWTFKVVE